MTRLSFGTRVSRRELRGMAMRGAMRLVGDPRGVALLTVLLFMVLMFILVSAMLIAAGKEILIAGLHRDAIRAEEHAQAGLEDIVRRMEGGRAWKPGAVDAADRCAQDDGSRGVRMSLPGSDTCTSVLTRLAGPSGSFLEVRSDGAAGRARRRLTAAVLAQTGTALPGVLVLHSLIEDPGTEIGSGTVHAHAFVRYLAAASADRTTYAGWRIQQTPLAPGVGIGPCYTHEECRAADRPQWWPGHRRAVYGAHPLRPTSLPGNLTPDRRTPGVVLGYGCPAGPLPGQAAQAIGTDGPGFQSTDLRADLNPADPLQAAIASEPLYGCTSDGLPYTWLREAFDTEDDPDTDPDRFLWFQVVRFDQWLTRYGCFDEGALSWTPCNGFHPDPLQGDPSLGAVLPLMPGEVWSQNPDQRKTGGGPLTPADLDFGTCTDPPACQRPANNRTTIALDGGDYTLLCLGSCPEGHGVLIVDGDLLITGAFTYRGIVIVRGALTVSSGTVSIHGTASAGRVTNLGGVLRLLPGTPVAIGAAGPVAVRRRAWWER